MEKFPADLSKARKSTAIFLGVIIISLSSLVLLGWVIDNEILKRVVPNYVQMNPMSAVNFIVLSVGLLLAVFNKNAISVSKMLGMYVFLFGLLILARYVMNFDLHIDELLFTDQLEGNRMAPNTAFCFLTAGLILFFLDVKNRYGKIFIEGASFLIILITAQALIGYLYNFVSLYQIKTFIPMAVHVAFSFILVACAFFAYRPDFYISSFLSSVFFGNSIGKKVNLFLLFGFFILVGISIISYINIQRSFEVSDELSRQLSAQLLRDRLFADLLSAEAAQRGYIITGKEDYLDPYFFSLNNYQPTLEKLREASKTDPRDLEIINKTEQLIEERFSILAFTISLREEKGFVAAKAIIDTDEGKKIMDQIRSNISHMMVLDQQDQALLAQRQKEIFTTTAQTAVGGAVIALIIVILALFFINRDLKERKKLEDKIAEDEARFRAILENMTEGLMVTGPDGKFTFFNHAAEAMLGVGMSQESPEAWQKIYGVFLSDKVTPFPAVDFPLVKALQGQKTYNVEQYIMNNKLREGIFILVNGSPLLDREGKIVGGVAVFSNITERKKAEEKLFSEKMKAEAMLGSIGDGVFAIDKNSRIILFNRAAEIISGYTKDEAIGKHYKEILQFYSGRDHTPLDGFIRLALSGQKAEMAPHTNIQRKDQTLLPVADSAAPILGKTGDIEGAVVVFRDITKEREVEKLKDEFLSVASHELRTPMTAIKGLVSMILEGEFGGVGNELKSPLSDIATSTNRLINLVNDLLNVSRIEAGRMKFTLSDVSLPQLITSVVATLQPLTQQKKLLLHAENIPDIQIQTDPDKLQQVLTNVIGNAIKFTDQGSISISAKEDRELAIIFITDTGIGISKENQEKLFGRFQQVSSQKDGRPVGTGLGLYISKELARKMGGDLWIEKSEVGKGTTFGFSIPLAKSQKAITIKKEIDNEAGSHPDQK